MQEQARDADLCEVPLGARDYLAAAPAVTRVSCDLPVPRLDDALRAGPAHPAALLELSDRWGLESPLNRFLAAVETALSA